MTDVLSSAMTDLRALAAPLLVLALLLGAGATLATFLPSSSPDGATCGTWLAPATTREDLAGIRAQTDGLEERATDSALAGVRRQAQAIGDRAEAAYRSCDDTLSTRRLVTLAGLALGGMSGALGAIGLRRRGQGA